MEKINKLNIKTVNLDQLNSNLMTLTCVNTINKQTKEMRHESTYITAGRNVGEFP